MRLGIVIPAINEEETVGEVVERSLRSAGPLGDLRVVVSDNGSEDGTATAAVNAGAEVVHVSKRGYGAACLGGIAHLSDWPSLILFLDADGSSRPEEIPLLVEGVANEKYDLVIGCRPRSATMTPPQRWGTWLAVRAVNYLWNCSFSDMGPFRCITKESFDRLGMSDETWGWTIEMQILARVRGLRIQEVPVSWDQRVAGVSKISGTVSGVVRAGLKIFWTIWRYALASRFAPTDNTR